MPVAIGVLTLNGFTASLTALADDGNGSISAEMVIVDIAVAAGQFNTLATGLIATLKSDGPFTVFTPTGEAFGKPPTGMVESLPKSENHDMLVMILTYHVVPKKVMAKDVVNLSEAATPNGSDISIMVMDGNIRINNAVIDTKNGVIHIVDTVILPN